MRLSSTLHVVLVGSLVSAYAPGVAAQPDGAGVPIEVREVVHTPAGVQATLVNTSTHVVTMYEITLQRADGTGLSMSGG